EREIGAADARAAAERRGDVPHRQQVPHLLDRDIEQHAAPAAYRRRLGRIQALPLAVLQAEGGIQVGAHEVVLELGGLVQAVDEDLALRQGRGRGEVV